MHNPAPTSYCEADRGVIFLALSWILLSVGMIVVSLRLYVRLGPRYKVGWDDYTAVASLLVGVVSGGFYTKTIAVGLGRHPSCNPQDTMKYIAEFMSIDGGLNIVGIGLVKISVCLALLRIVELALRRIAQFLWCLLIFIAITHLALAMLYFLHCRPLSGRWGPQEQAVCLPAPTTDILILVGAAIDIVTDLVCAIIPVLVIRRLQMNVRTKATLCGLMGLGVFTAVCAAAKSISLIRARDDEYSWDFAVGAIWAAVEQFLGIIIASIPALRPLFENSRNWFTFLSSTKEYSQGGNKDSGFISIESSQPQQQQSYEINCSQGSRHSETQLAPYRRNSEVKARHCPSASSSTTLDEYHANGSADEFGDFAEMRGVDFLSACHLPT